MYDITGNSKEHPRDLTPPPDESDGPSRGHDRPLPHGHVTPITGARVAEDEPTWDPNVCASFGVRELSGCAVVVAYGEIDLSTAPMLRSALAAGSLLSARVVLDLTRVTFLDSSGIAAMIGAHKYSYRGQQVSLCLVGTSAMVRRALDVTHVSQMFSLYQTLAEALARPHDG
jgi:anti-sigma B factor antagonist